jgi:Tol biopolymer transport system component
MLRWHPLALIISLAAFTPPAFASSAGPVVYATYAKLATVNPDGTDIRLLVPGSQPVWSPNGRWIAYTHQYEEIWRVRGDGTDAQRIVRDRDKELGEPTWSPNGRQVAYTAAWYTDADDDDHPDGVRHAAVYVARRDGSDRRLLRRDASAPAWSPTGRRIAFWMRYWIATVKPNGRDFRLVHRSRESLSAPPSFSPNGRWLLYLTSTPERVAAAARRINVLNMRTGALRQIPLDVVAGWSSDVTWTPGGRIAFLHHAWTREGGLTPLTPVQLRTVRRDGTDPQTLATLPEAVTGDGLSWRWTD